MIFEIASKLINQKTPHIKKRFFQDPDENVMIYIWQNLNDLNNSNLGVERFQISFGSNFIEWVVGKGVAFATVDDGDGMVGISGSPVLFFKKDINIKVLNEFFIYFDKNIDKNIKELLLIQGILQKLK